MRLILCAATLGVVLAGCATTPRLPANLPDLIDLAGERVETQAVVQAQGLRTVLSETALTRNDLAAIRQDLEALDRERLPADHRQTVANAIARLQEAEQSLTFSEQIQALPARMEAVSAGVGEALAVVSGVITEKLSYEQQIQRAIAKLTAPGQEE